MPLGGMYLTVLVGHKYAPLPAPDLADSLTRVEVTHSYSGRSGFQLTFRAPRSEGFFNPIDFPVLLKRRLQPFKRVVLVVTINAIPQVLMDGIITDQQLIPEDREQASLTVTGEDIGVLMDMDEEVVEHPALTENLIVAKILASYLALGVVPKIIPPPVLDVPIPIERVPVQHGTDLDYMEAIAARYGYTFFIRPGPLPLMNQAYWGPPISFGVPQRALTINMGPADNLNAIQFRYDALAPERVRGRVHHSSIPRSIPYATVGTLRPPLESQPALYAQLGNVRKRWNSDIAGLDLVSASARAQGMTDASVDRVAIAEGELNGIKYEGVLQAGRTVGVRGVGYSYDGFYYVRQVTHTIDLKQDSGSTAYTQQFTLHRGGLGSLSPVVVP